MHLRRLGVIGVMAAMLEVSPASAGQPEIYPLAKVRRGLGQIEAGEVV